MNAESLGKQPFPIQRAAKGSEGHNAHHLFQKYTSTASENQAFVIRTFKHTPYIFYPKL